MTTLATPVKAGFHELPLAVLQASSLNPRRHVGDMTDLAASIAEKGILEPLLVRPVGNERFEIVAGERRFRAAQIAGVAVVPTIVRELTDPQVIELAIIENNQRQDVHPLDEAEAFAQLRALDRTYAPEVIASKIGRPLAYVKGRLKLLELVPVVKEAFLGDRITIGHAERLARLSPDLQPRALKECFAPLWEYSQDDDDAYDDDDFGDDVDGADQEAAAPPSKAPASEVKISPTAVLRPVAALEKWVRNHVVLDVKSPEVQEALPQLAEQVERLEATGATIVALSTAYSPSHGLKGKAAPLPMSSWREVEGKACKAAVQGVVVYGSDRRAQILTVCLKASKCPKHWPSAAAPARGKAAGGESQHDRWKREEDERRQKREAWEELQPKMRAALAQHFAGRVVDSTLACQLAEQLNVIEDVKRHIGSISAKNLGQVLWFSLALADDWWTEEAASEALKTFGFDLPAFKASLQPTQPAPSPAHAPAKKGGKKR
jgi:ParB/RepB/Spo0J family partition protein